MTNAIGTNVIGPSFGAEIAAASLGGLPFSWGSDGQFTWGPNVTDAEKVAVAAVLAAHNPANADPYAAYAAALKSGVTVASSGTPAISGLYGCAPDDQSTIATLQAASAAGVFPGYYDKIDGTAVEVTSAQFAPLATAILQYVVALKSALRAATQSGGKWVSPAATATIA